MSPSPDGAGGLRPGGRLALRIVGALLVLSGGVWFLQGAGILPGSFMSGRREWSVNGALAIALGLALLWWSARRRSAD
jgi:hypothetical protein